MVTCNVTYLTNVKFYNFSKNPLLQHVFFEENNTSSVDCNYILF